MMPSPHEHLYDYFMHIGDFVQNVCITLMGNKGLHISFQFMSYDLIDLELDFDEDYYEDMRTNIVNVLVNECKKLTDNFDHIDIYQAITLMTKMTKMEQYVVITNETTTITKYNKS
jgi:hypothetical protein